MSKSVNMVILLGNITNDPELRYTPTEAAVCTFTIATTRRWTTEAGNKNEETEFHRIVTWNKLAEISSNILKKGAKVHLVGRIATRKWKNKEDKEMKITEIIADDIINIYAKEEKESPEGQASLWPEQS